jgi:hypothetical protein
MAGLPTEAFELATQVVSAQLVAEGYGEDDEPPKELRMPLLRRALQSVREKKLLT